MKRMRDLFPGVKGAQHHMFSRMAFRNLLRDIIKDNELPTGKLG